MKKLPGGLWPVMLTPFREDNSIDEEGLRVLTEYYLAAGADGLFANCLTSEMFQLTDEEKIQITKITIEQVNGRVPVVSTGTFGNDLKKNADFIKKIYETGAAAVVVNSNQLNENKESENDFKISLEKLMGATGEIPLGMYECPVPYKRLISPGLLKWMGESGRFLYMKDTCCDLDAMVPKIKALENTPLGLYNANTPTGLGSLREGAVGLSPTAANYYAELYTWLIARHTENTPEVSQMAALLSILDATADNIHYPLAAKMFLKKRGLNISLTMRNSKPALTHQDYIKLNAMMELVQQKAKDLGIKMIEF